MNKRNYQRELDNLLLEIKKSCTTPKLLVHSCCAPCSSYVLEYLSEYFDITVLYYNPNISPKEEYEYRKAEQIRLINRKTWTNPVNFMDCDWEGDVFDSAIKGYEHENEGGPRCKVCFSLRLSKTAEIAKTNGFDFFVTTLSISPLKNADLLNEIGETLSKQYDIKYLPSDFKKREGYKRSIELSREFDLYRQDYCGCVYSKR